MTMPAKRCIIKAAQLKYICCLGGIENMMEENNAVEICGLSKSYGGNKALDNISFSVRRGEIMGFLGPNGAGKSTTMNILTGCISASQGSVTVCGCDVLENPKIVKGKIGYLPEQPPLYFDMTVYEYLSFVYDLKKVKNLKTKASAFNSYIKFTYEGFEYKLTNCASKELCSAIEREAR